jgi:tetratricopeptide (TPR) repeat protein
MPAEKRVGYLHELRKQHSGVAEVSFHLANAHYTLSSFDSAEVYYREAIAIDSTLSKAYVNLSLALENQRRFGEAEKILHRALEINPNDVLALCHVGQRLYERGDYGKAIEHYNRALEVDPDNAQAHYNLGLAFADAKMFSEALLEWETVVKLGGGDELARTAAENVRLIRQYMKVKAP